LWLGTVAPAVGSNYAFTGKPIALYLIDAGYPLVSLCMMGALLAVWL
jgi:hypothetical protein